MNFNEIINRGDLEVCKVLTEFIRVASAGITKPYSHEHYLNFIRDFAKKENIELSDAIKCCLPSSEVREAKELKPYIIAAADKITDILKLEVSYDYRR